MPSEIITENLGLNKWEGNEYPKRTDFVSDNEIIDEAIGKLESLKTENKSNIVAAVNEVREQNENLAEDVDELFQSVSNGKAIVAGAITDKGVSTSPTATFETMADKIDAIETDPSIGTTDATAADILDGKKAVSQGELRTGTMPNRGPISENVVNLTEQNQEYTIAYGFHSGLRKIKAVIAGLAANVIKAGATVGGTLGTFTSDATATAAQMLSGAIAYVNGNKITGTIPSKSAQTYTPGTTNQTIAAGQYLSGIQTIQGSANLSESNIKNNVNIFGKVGTFKGISKFEQGTIQASSNGQTFSLNQTYDLSRTILIIMPRGRGIKGSNFYPVYAKLTGNSTITVYYTGKVTTSYMSYQVIEFDTSIVKSFQSGDTSNTSSPANITISALTDINKAIAIVNGFAWDNSGPYVQNPSISITSVTTISIINDAYPNAFKCNWQVIEFY